jgi:hypothetical protein
MVEAVKKLEVAEAALATTDITVDLLKPVMAHGETPKQIKFHEPTGNDMMQFGSAGRFILIGRAVVTPNPGDRSGDVGARRCRRQPSRP